MPLFKRKNKSKRRTDTGGFTTYDDVFQIVKEEINDAVEFYEIEPMFSIISENVLNLINQFNLINSETFLLTVSLGRPRLLEIKLILAPFEVEQKTSFSQIRFSFVKFFKLILLTNFNIWG